VASLSFLDAVERHHDLLERVTEIPSLAGPGIIKFIVVTFEGLRTASVDTGEEPASRHPLVELNDAAGRDHPVRT
jgi:hypothetical protein